MANDKTQPWDFLSSEQQQLAKNLYARRRTLRDAQGFSDIFSVLDDSKMQDAADYYAVDAENDYNRNMWDTMIRDGASRYDGYVPKTKTVPKLADVYDKQLNDIEETYKLYKNGDLSPMALGISDEDAEAYYQDAKQRTTADWMLASYIDEGLQKIADNEPDVDINDLLEYGKKAFDMAKSGKPVLLHNNCHSFPMADDETLYTNKYDNAYFIPPYGQQKADYLKEVADRFGPTYEFRQQEEQEFQDRIKAEQKRQEQIEQKYFERFGVGDSPGSDSDTRRLDYWRALGGDVEGEPSRTRNIAPPEEKPRIKATVSRKQEAPKTSQYTGTSVSSKIRVVTNNNKPAVRQNRQENTNVKRSPIRRQFTADESVAERVLRETNRSVAPTIQLPTNEQILQEIKDIRV